MVGMITFLNKTSKCPLCGNGIEDNEHFLVKCDDLGATREEFLTSLHQQVIWLKEKPLSFQLRELLTVNFKTANVIDIVAKGFPECIWSEKN